VLLAVDILKAVARTRCPTLEDLEIAMATTCHDSGFLDALDACVEYGYLHVDGALHVHGYILSSRGRQALRASATALAAA
jgi:hypothetical protein